MEIQMNNYISQAYHTVVKDDAHELSALLKADQEYLHKGIIQNLTTLAAEYRSMDCLQLLVSEHQFKSDNLGLLSHFVEVNDENALLVFLKKEQEIHTFDDRDPFDILSQQEFFHVAEGECAKSCLKGFDTLIKHLSPDVVRRNLLGSSRLDKMDNQCEIVTEEGSCSEAYSFSRQFLVSSAKYHLSLFENTSAENLLRALLSFVNNEYELYVGEQPEKTISWLITQLLTEHDLTLKSPLDYTETVNLNTNYAISDHLIDAVVYLTNNDSLIENYKSLTDQIIDSYESEHAFLNALVAMPKRIMSMSENTTKREHVLLPLLQSLGTTHSFNVSSSFNASKELMKWLTSFNGLGEDEKWIWKHFTQSVSLEIIPSSERQLAPELQNKDLSYYLHLYLETNVSNAHYTDLIVFYPYLKTTLIKGAKNNSQTIDGYPSYNNPYNDYIIEPQDYKEDTLMNRVEQALTETRFYQVALTEMLCMPLEEAFKLPKLAEGEIETLCDSATSLQSILPLVPERHKPAIMTLLERRM